MRRGRIILIFLFIALLIIVGALVVWRFFLSAPAEPETVVVTPTTEKVALLAREVSKGDQIAIEDIEFKDWPLDQVTADMFREADIEEKIQDGARYRNDLIPGTPLMRNMVIGKDELISGCDRDYRIVDCPAGRLHNCSKSAIGLCRVYYSKAALYDLVEV